MRYFLDIRDGDTLIRDLDGADFASLSDACAEAMTAAREMVADGIRSGRDTRSKRFEICDGAGAALAVVPFGPIGPTVKGAVGGQQEMRSHLRPPGGSRTTARRFSERMRLALALRLAVRNAPRVVGVPGLPAEGLTIDPNLASDAASALEEAARETWRNPEADPPPRG